VTVTETEPARNPDLEAAAFADPQDFDSWRVYADWLQSVGDPRGELASLDLLRKDAFRSQRMALAEQIRERQQPFIDSFHTWAQDRDIADDVRVKFRYGFVYELEGPLSQLAPVLDELFERHPIQRLKLGDVEDDTLAQVCEARPAWFSRLLYLRLSGKVAARGCEGLARCPLPRLERLNLLGNNISTEGCRHLASLDTTVLAGLTLTANDIDEEGLDRLLESPTRGQWRQLYLSANPLGAEGIERLANATGLEQLEGLYLCDVEVAFNDYALLMDSPNLPSLRSVELSSYGSWRARELRDRMKQRWPGLDLR
jgi:uncharacterized protein (TIGR02996 family)